MLQKPNASRHVIPYLSDAEMESMLSFIKNKLPVQEQEAKVIHDGKKKKKNLQIIYVETLRQSFVNSLDIPGTRPWRETILLGTTWLGLEYHIILEEELMWSQNRFRIP